LIFKNERLFGKAFCLLSISILKDKTLKYITLNGINFNDMLEEDLSGGQT